MFGVTITEGPTDWQVYQQTDDSAIIKLSGNWQLPDAAIKVGFTSAKPRIRVLDEQNHAQIVPWKDMLIYSDPSQVTGSWQTEIKLESGGPFTIETGLMTQSVNPEQYWIFRGDLRLHICIGDVFVMAGQSNSAGYGHDSAYDPPETGIHVFRSRREWDLASHPLQDTTDIDEQTTSNIDMGITGTSPYLAFARIYKQLSHRPIGLISTALGGSGLDQWLPAGNGQLYANMLEQMRRCGGRCAGILWYQGCTDAMNGTGATYYDRFKSFVTSVRHQLGYDIPFFTYQLNRFTGQAENNLDEWGIVREAQRRLAHDLSGVYVMPALNPAMCDGIHNSASANINLGERLARQAASALCGSTEYQAPETKKITIEGGKIIVEFDHVKGNLLIINANPEQNGFSLFKAGIKQEITSTKVIDSNKVEIETSIEIDASCELSFAEEANPTYTPIIDNATYLPPLATYRQKIVLK
jgi:hypothetical protein